MEELEPKDRHFLQRLQNGTVYSTPLASAKEKIAQWSSSASSTVTKLGKSVKEQLDNFFNKNKDSPMANSTITLINWWYNADKKLNYFLYYFLLRNFIRFQIHPTLCCFHLASLIQLLYHHAFLYFKSHLLSSTILRPNSWSLRYLRLWPLVNWPGLPSG